MYLFLASKPPKQDWRNNVSMIFSPSSWRFEFFFALHRPFKNGELKVYRSCSSCEILKSVKLSHGFFSNPSYIVPNLVKWREIDTCNAICQAKRAKTFNVNLPSLNTILLVEFSYTKKLPWCCSLLRHCEKRITNKENWVPIDLYLAAWGQI